MDENDPARAAFLADQQAASTEHTIREEAAWKLNIRNGAANASETEGRAAYLQAKAAFWEAVSTLIWVAILAVALGTIVVAGIAGWQAVR